jgi:hypothetical protein
MKRTASSRCAAIGIALLCLAPGAGNIGSCGQAAEPLDARKFLELKASIDCSRCDECQIASGVCTAACEGEVPAEAAFPQGCLPLVHDGEVCLDALIAAACDDYARYTADQGATIPTECNFCPVDAAGQPDRGTE